MSWVDIFYLTLVVCAFSGFAAVLAYFANQDVAYRAGLETEAPQAKTPAKGQVHQKMLKAA